MVVEERWCWGQKILPFVGKESSRMMSPPKMGTGKKGAHGSFPGPWLPWVIVIYKEFRLGLPEGTVLEGSALSSHQGTPSSAVSAAASIIINLVMTAQELTVSRHHQSLSL